MAAHGLKPRLLMLHHGLHMPRRARHQAAHPFIGKTHAALQSGGGEPRSALPQLRRLLGDIGLQATGQSLRRGIQSLRRQSQHVFKLGQTARQAVKVLARLFQPPRLRAQ